jgi:asparagine synthase (glutamine-hydrolysing)
MTNALVHRGPDAEGYHSDSNISLGHRRLSIVDLSTNANQPFIDASGRYILVFNGMIYNYKELKSQLPDYPFVSSGDTEVLMAAFCKWGIDCLQKLEGMFAFAIWDTLNETLWLARDRMGVKPLYYFQDGKRVIFSSEKRSILASGLVTPAVDKHSLFEFLSYHSTGYPGSMIAGIKQLSAGSFMKVAQHHSEIVIYWKPTTHKYIIDNDPVAVRKKLFDTINSSVTKRMVADVPLGVFLSGGIDSTAIMALMSLNSTEKINSFTLSFNVMQYDESGFADLAAKRFNTNHTKYLLKPERFLDMLSNGLDAMDSPSADGINTYVLSGALRSVDIKVALSGMGGDELFAGYPGFTQFYKLNKFSSLYNLLYPARKGFSRLLKLSSSNKWRRLSGLLAVKHASIDEIYPIMRQVLSPGMISELTTDSQGETAIQKSIFKDLHEIQKFDSLSQYSITEYMGYAQTTLLKDTDQMSMAVGLEIREPFFDHHLIEYVLSLSNNLKYPYSPKQLLVESLRPLIPKEIAIRPKQGFEIPWKSWMKNELQQFCDAQINDIAQRDFINGPKLINYWKRFLKGDPSVRWVELWQFVVLGYWLRKNGIN